jgi:nitrous oxidase accessory protein
MPRAIQIFWVVALIMAIGSPVGAAETGLQALIDQAEPGSTLILTPGLYAGNVVIDKPLELRGEGWPTIDGHGKGNVITINSSDVTLTGLNIVNTGDSLDQENAGVSANGARIRVVGNRLSNVLFGIYLRRGADSVVAGNEVGAMHLDIARRGDGIRLWESPGCVVEGNVVDGGRDTVLWFSDDLTIRDNTVTNGRYGLHFMYSDRAVVEGNYLSGNSVGGFLMYSHDLTLIDNLITDSRGPSGYGIGLKDIDGVEATGNRFLSNRIGVYLDNSPATPGVEHLFENNLFAYNDVGVAFLPSVKGNVFTSNAFVDNGQQVGIHGKGVFEGNIWTVQGLGNHWSDFAGYDADRDGVGDVPYRLADLYSSLTDSNPDLHFFDQTPASRAINLASQMFPTFRPRPKVEDAAPLMEIPALSAPVRVPEAGSALATLAASLALLGTAVALVGVSHSSHRRIRL